VEEEKTRNGSANSMLDTGNKRISSKIQNKKQQLSGEIPVSEKKVMVMIHHRQFIKFTGKQY